MDKEVLAWVSEALRESHADERRFHDEAISRLNADHLRVQTRLDVLYEDKLDGRIDVAFFDRKARDWRAQQNRLLADIGDHQNANQSYMEEGVRILELAVRASELFERQPAEEKRRLLNCVLSNSSWKEGKLTAQFRQPFDMLVVAKESAETAVVAQHPEKGVFEIWLPDMDSNHGSRRQRPLSYH